MATASVLADLDSIRNLFNEKEKELSVAVKKVDDLTHQLEELRSGRLANGYPPQVNSCSKNLAGEGSDPKSRALIFFYHSIFRIQSI